jgi:hypothetical protein
MPVPMVRWTSETGTYRPSDTTMLMQQVRAAP